MTTEAPITSSYDAGQGSFRVATPYVGDVVSGALHHAYDGAYDGRDDLPADLRCLLDCLDRVD
jgi:hypothetical protein